MICAGLLPKNIGKDWTMYLSSSENAWRFSINMRRSSIKGRNVSIGRRLIESSVKRLIYWRSMMWRDICGWCRFVLLFPVWLEIHMLLSFSRPDASVYVIGCQIWSCQATSQRDREISSKARIQAAAGKVYGNTIWKWYWWDRNWKFSWKQWISCWKWRWKWSSKGKFPTLRLSWSFVKLITIRLLLILLLF